MKTLLNSFLLFSALLLQAQGQSINYVIQKISKDPTTNGLSNIYRSFTVREGESLHVSGPMIYGDSRMMVKAVIGGYAVDWPQAFGSIPGPAEVVIGWNPVYNPENNLREIEKVGDIWTIVRVNITPDPFPPNKTVIIPAGSKGGALELEMSTDLVRWTPTVPATYSSPTNNLFFRLYLKSVP